MLRFFLACLKLPLYCELLAVPRSYSPDAELLVPDVPPGASVSRELPARPQGASGYTRR